jgi:carbonic anhydrase
MAALTPHGDVSPEIRMDTAENGQHPYAIVITCSDSRVIPESIFSAGIGELFVVRVAGNVIDDHQLGSIEYAVEHLGIELVVVLGHTGCGAVGASLKGETGGHVSSITRDIIQAIGNEKKALEASILNTVYQAHKVKEAFPDVTTVPALYDIHSGEIIWLE